MRFKIARPEVSVVGDYDLLLCLRRPLLPYLSHYKDKRVYATDATTVSVSGENNGSQPQRYWLCKRDNASKWRCSSTAIVGKESS